MLCHSEDELRVVRAEPLEVAVQVNPYAGEDTRQQYVQTWLLLRTGDDYPEIPAAVKLQDTKG